MASKIGDVNLVEFILENVNPPMYDQHGRTPIHFAALNGHSEVVKIIISYTQIPNVADLYGMTPIHLATKNGHANVVQVLTPCSSWNLLDFNTVCQNKGPSRVYENRKIQRSFQGSFG